MVVKRSFAFLLFAAAVCGCSQHPHNLYGKWRGATLTVSDSSRHESVTVPVEKFGYVNLYLAQDSTFEFGLGVLRDVTLDRPVFGLDTRVTLLKAVYKSTKFGQMANTDSEIVLRSRNDSIFVRPSSDTSSLILRFKDNNGRHWLCTLIPKE
jgi:hypothetical protein